MIGLDGRPGGERAFRPVGSSKTGTDIPRRYSQRLVPLLVSKVPQSVIEEEERSIDDGDGWTEERIEKRWSTNDAARKDSPATLDMTRMVERITPSLVKREIEEHGGISGRLERNGVKWMETRRTAGQECSRQAEKEHGRTWLERAGSTTPRPGARQSGQCGLSMMQLH
jgi:hypothetical protein